ncbi:kinase domain protein [Gardnerella vaginalis]|uniref:non-specific serine/threonine protein kinase n=1 Tax=Gardnerella vaginalis TaxID=2702 RepID=A0A135Z5N8_GARVA|nr:serine/threonine-protein kinase [Gardnerella vaginalis]KXI16975.1 kinase domain protein [Gardnerella vaginalis]
MNDISMFNLNQGSNIGGYTLIKRLGGGAMGSVWKVRDDGGQEYAMKILRENASEDDYATQSEQNLARTRLRREALALQRINHIGVCSIVDMELDASIAFIVTELIEGLNLKEDVAENGPYIRDDLERLAHKLIDAIKAVHSAGIVHRDIKPTNVMISATGPVLVDFGIAMGEGESHVTRTGLVMGTPGFIAPEIIEGGDSDELTDWWSLAAVLAFAATGRPVFGTKPMMAVLERAACGNANLNGIPPRTMDALRSALNPNRNQRCTPEELEEAIAKDAENPLAWQGAMLPFELNISESKSDDENTSEPYIQQTSKFSSDMNYQDSENTSQTINVSHETEEDSETISFNGVRNIENNYTDITDTYESNYKNNKNKENENYYNNSQADSISKTLNVRKMWTDDVLPTSILDRTTHIDTTPVAVGTTPVGTTPVGATPIDTTPIDTGTIPAYTTTIAATQETDPPIENSVIQAENTNPTQQANLSQTQDDYDSKEENLNQKARPYLLRGTLFLLIFMPILLATTCISTSASLFLHAIFMIICATTGYNVSSHIHRQKINDGIGKDRLLRIFFIPWHFLKAILYTIPSLLILSITSISFAYIYPLLIKATCQLMEFPIYLPEWLFVKKWVILLPSYTPEIFSPTSIGYAVGVLIGWIIVSLFGRSRMIRLGLGAIFGAGRN